MSKQKQRNKKSDINSEDDGNLQLVACVMNNFMYARNGNLVFYSVGAEITDAVLIEEMFRDGMPIELI